MADVPPTETAAAPGGGNTPVRTGRWRSRLLLGLVILVLLGAGGWRYRVTRPDYRLARGEAALQEKDWDEVVRYIERLEAAGHADHASLLRGQALRANGRPDLAIVELDKVSAAGPLRVRAAAVSARCLLDLGNLREAHQAFSFVLSEQPDHVDAHRGLAAIAYDLGQLGTAVDHLRRAAELDPNDGRPHRLIGLILSITARDERSVDAYREALRRGLPEDMEPEARIDLAEVLVKIGRFAEAVEVLDADTSPGRQENPKWLTARAEGLRGAGRQKEATELLDRELGKHRAASLHRVRGHLYLEQDNVSEAVRHFEQAVQLDPADYQAHLALAQAYAGMGRKDDATRGFAQAEELRKDYVQITDLTHEAMSKPWDPEVRLRLAALHEKLGKTELAKSWREAAAACRRSNR